MDHKPGIFHSWADVGMLAVLAFLVYVVLAILAGLTVKAETTVYDCHIVATTTYPTYDSALVAAAPLADTGAIEVVPIPRGDVNGNDTVSLVDIIYLVRYVLKHDTLPVLDGAVNYSVYLWADTLRLIVEAKP